MGKCRPRQKALEGPALLEGSGSLHTDSRHTMSAATSPRGYSRPNRGAQLLERHCRGGKWDTNGDGGSAGLAIGLREMKHGDAFLKITPIIPRFPLLQRQVETDPEQVQCRRFQEYPFIGLSFPRRQQWRQQWDDASSASRIASTIRRQILVRVTRRKVARWEKWDRPWQP
jgi:hypothetical protein